MSTPASYKVFVSAVSNELESYREEVARVLRRRGIDVRDQVHFRQGGGTLLEQLRDYIDECHATISLIGEQSGSVPGSEHVSDAGVQSEWADRLRDASGNNDISYTQWEYLLAKTLGKETYVFLTDDGFVPDKPPRGADSDAQACYREWIRSTGENWSPLTTMSQLIEDVLVLPFPDLSQGQPNNLPHGSLGSLFKGREQFLNDLREQLGNESIGATTAITSKADPARPAAVHGAGGIGKTRCAIEYAWRHSSDYTALLFLSADSPQALDSSLASLTGVLAIDGLDEAKPEQRIHAALNWLQAYPGWLAILDNVDTGKAAKAVKSRLPALTQGHVLITSRLSRWSSSVQTLYLGVLTLEDATSYLLEATDANRVRTAQDHEKAELVAKKVGQLALGLEHAAAWIKAHWSAGFDEYLRKWDENEADILESFDLDLIEYPTELLVTWNLSVNQLDEPARRLLEILSWLAPEPVPEFFLESAPEGIGPTLNQSMAELAKYSLLSRVEGQDQRRGFQIHRLVQATSRWHQRNQKDSALLSLDLALNWMEQAFVGNPQDVESWAALSALATHAESLAGFLQSANKVGEGFFTSTLLSQLGRLFHHQASHSIAEVMYRRALSITETAYGSAHPELAVRFSNLATLLQEKNRHCEAEELMRKALSIDELSYGKNHPLVAIRLNNLGQLLQELNQLNDAESMMRRALSIDEASYGDEHLTVARDLHNLAMLLQAMGRLEEAEPLVCRALAIEEKNRGKDHPNVARCLINLAQLYRSKDRLFEAESLVRRALMIDIANYGHIHPTVATDLSNLALLLLESNRQSESLSSIKRALSIDENIYGQNHPFVAIRLSILGQVLLKTNELSEAEEALIRAVDISVQSYGENHPDVGLYLHSLAQVHRARNRLDQVEHLLRRIIAIFHRCGQIAGCEHPYLSMVKNEYIDVLVDLGLSNDDAVERVREMFSVP